MRRTDFQFDLPAELIAQAPLPERSASRLLTVDGATGATADRRFADLPALLRADDLLVFNDTRVVAARVFGTKPSGGRVEIFLERAIGAQRALAQLRASKAIRPDLEIQTPGGVVRVVDRHDDLWEIQTPGEVLAFFDAHGHIPLPPYITREDGELDRERYQSVFARVPGAVAAPTASLHFDAPLLERIAARGVAMARVTLHVGAGTFQPLRVEELSQHVMHAERFAVDAALVEAVQHCHARGGRVIAVGTTALRALESAAADGTIATGAGDTRLFITPGYRLRTADHLLTNFHLPESTLFVLVSALLGTGVAQAAYAEAVRERYRFFSYGDAMLILNARRSG